MLLIHFGDFLFRTIKGSSILKLMRVYLWEVNLNGRKTYYPY